MVTVYKKDDLQVDPGYIDYIINFVKFAAKVLKMDDQDFKIFLLGKGQDNQSTTGGYNPSNDNINALYEGRALIDILRSIAHEMEHQRQNKLNLIPTDKQPQDIGGFLENDANIIAGILIKLYVKHYLKDRSIYFM